MRQFAKLDEDTSVVFGLGRGFQLYILHIFSIVTAALLQAVASVVSLKERCLGGVLINVVAFGILAHDIPNMFCGV